MKITLLIVFTTLAISASKEALSDGPYFAVGLGRTFNGYVDDRADGERMLSHHGTSGIIKAGYETSPMVFGPYLQASFDFSVSHQSSLSDDLDRGIDQYMVLFKIEGKD